MKDPMPEATTPETLVTSRFPNRWALFPIGLLGILVTVQLVLFSMSRTDPSFAVEPEYYKKAVNWDQEMQQRAANSNLGWRSDVQFTGAAGGGQLRIALTDGQKIPITGAAIKAVAFPNARAAMIQQVPLKESEPGLYTGPLQLSTRGEWEVRLTAMHNGRTFTHSTRVQNP
jgi:nitrogen fixation protein FixH